MVFILFLGPVGNLILISEIWSHYLGRTYQSGNQRSPFLIGTCPGWLTSTMLYLMLNNLNIIESKIYFIYKFNTVDYGFHNSLLLFLNVLLSTVGSCYSSQQQKYAFDTVLKSDFFNVLMVCSRMERKARGIFGKKKIEYFSQ